MSTLRHPETGPRPRYLDDQKPPYQLSVLQRQIVMLIHQRRQPTLDQLYAFVGVQKSSDKARVRRCIDAMTSQFVIPGDVPDTFMLTARATEIAMNVQAAAV